MSVWAKKLLFGNQTSLKQAKFSQWLYLFLEEISCYAKKVPGNGVRATSILQWNKQNQEKKTIPQTYTVQQIVIHKHTIHKIYTQILTDNFSMKI